MMQSGCSELEITPHLGEDMPGYFHRRPSRTILDRLYVRAWVVDNGKTTMAIASLDCIGLKRPWVVMAKERVRSLCGIPPENILIASSHTHTGGPVCEHEVNGIPNPGYWEFISKRVADAIVLAWQDRGPSQLSFGTDTLDGYSFCRIYHMRDGGLKTNPGAQNPDNVRPFKEIDKRVSVIKIAREGKIRGIVVHFTCHCDVVNSETGISADYPGILSQRLKERYGSGVHVLFLQGPCGDINHIDPARPDITAHADRYREIGFALAETVVGIMKRMEPAQSDHMGAVLREISIPMRLPDEKLLAWAEEIRAHTPLDLERLSRFEGDQVELHFALQAIRAHEHQLTSITTVLQVLFIGGLGIFTSPGELFSGYGDALLRQSPFQRAVVVAYANDYIGYIVTPECMAEGVYEYRQTDGMTLGDTAGPQMNQELTWMGAALKNRIDKDG